MIIIVLVGDADRSGSNIAATCVCTEGRYATLRGKGSIYQIYSLQEGFLEATPYQRQEALIAIGKQPPSPPPLRATFSSPNSSSSSGGCCS